MTGVEQNLAEVEQNIIQEMTEQLGCCKTSEDMFKVWLQYYLEYNHLPHETAGRDILEEKSQIAWTEAKKREAIEVLDNPKSTDEEKLEARKILWFHSINRMMEARLTPNFTQQDYLTTLEAVLKETPYPDGQIISVETYLASTEEHLSLD